MDDDFRSWKRRLGIVTLLVACVFTATWIRGIGHPFQVVIPDRVGREYVVETTPTRIRFAYEQFVVVGLRAPGPGTPIIEFGTPHWLIVIPLTLLSAWLLLSKLRRAKVNQTGFDASR